MMHTDPQAVREALSRVRCFLLDMDGTFYLGGRLLDGSLDFLEALRRTGRRALFVTNNSSKNAALYRRKLEGMGVPTGFLDVLTSGEATASLLRDAYPGRPAFVLGNDSLRDELRAGGIAIDERAPGVVVVGYDTTLTYDKLCACCDHLRAGLPFVATHPDVNCPTETGYAPDCGAFLAMIEASTGRRPDIVAGKPEASMLRAAEARTGLSRDSLAMVGDRLYTDIRLGVRHGMTSILVLTGEATRDDLPGSPDQPTIVCDRLSDCIGYL